MSRTSCITFPRSRRLVIIREEYVEICKDEKGKSSYCAAALLNLFQTSHESNSTKNESPVMPFTIKDLESGLMGTYARDLIMKSIKLLNQKGFVSKHKNPDKTQWRDRTNYFCFHPDAVNKALHHLETENLK